MNEWDVFWRWARRFRRQMIAWLIVYILALALAVAGGLWLMEALVRAAAPPSGAPRTEVTGALDARVVERMMVVTAYTCGPESTGKGPGHPAYRISRSGYRIRPHDRVVAAPPEIPYGAEVDVPGYGRAPVVDRGGAIVGDRLDVHIEHVPDALAWGVREVKVRIIYPAELGNDRGIKK